MQNSGSQRTRAILADKYLERLLRRTPEGGALPPLRSMMEESGLGQVVLSAATDRAEARGRVRREERRGVFRAAVPPLPEMVPVIDFVICGELREGASSGVFVEEMVTQLKAALTENGHALRVHHVRSADSFDPYRELAESAEMRACFLFAPHARELVNCFERRHVATLPLFPRIEPEILDHGIFDPEHLIGLLMEHLFSLGHQKIALLERPYPQVSRSLTLPRRADYYRHMAERGLRVARHWLGRAGFNEKEEAAAVETILATAPRPSALILPSTAMPVAYRVLENRGLRPGTDLALAGIDHARVCEQLRPVPTRAGVVHRETAELAVDRLLRRLTGDDAENKCHAPLRLAVGASCGPSAEPAARTDGALPATGEHRSATSPTHLAAAVDPSAPANRKTP